MLLGDAIQIDLDFLTRMGCEPDKIAHIIGDFDKEIIAADVFKKVEGTLQQLEQAGIQVGNLSLKKVLEELVRNASNDNKFTLGALCYSWLANRTKIGRCGGRILAQVWRYLD